MNAYHGQGGPLWVSDQIGPHELSRAFVRACQAWGLPYNSDFNGAEQFRRRILSGDLSAWAAAQRRSFLSVACAVASEPYRHDACARCQNSS